MNVALRAGVAGVEQRANDFVVGDGGILGDDVAAGRAVIAHRTGGHHQIPQVQLRIEPARVAHPKERVAPQLDQLFHQDRRTRRPNAGRRRRHRDTPRHPIHDPVLPHRTHLTNLTQPGRDILHPRRIPTKENVLRDIPRPKPRNRLLIAHPTSR